MTTKKYICMFISWICAIYSSSVPGLCAILCTATLLTRCGSDSFIIYRLIDLSLACYPPLTASIGLLQHPQHHCPPDNTWFESNQISSTGSMIHLLALVNTYLLCYRYLPL